MRDFIRDVAELTDSGVPREPSDSGCSAHPECLWGDEHRLIPNGARAKSLNPAFGSVAEFQRLSGSSQSFARSCFEKLKTRLSGEQLDF